jgi:hypothetical protein
MVPEAGQLYDGQNEAVAEPLVLRGGSCAWQAAGFISIGRADGRNCEPVLTAAANQLTHRT